MKRYICFVACMFLFVVFVGSVSAAIVNFSWCQEPDARITSYRLYYGINSSTNNFMSITNPGTTIPSGLKPNCPINTGISYDTYSHALDSALLDGSDHFTLTAVVDNVTESKRSNEVIISLPPVPPTVTLNLPLNNATATAVETSLSVTFSKDMDVRSINNRTFTVVDDGGLSVKGTIAYASKKVVFTPDIYLIASKTYTATLTTGITDIKGNSLLNPYSWTFTTEASPEIQADSGSLDAVLSKVNKGTSVLLKGDNNLYTGGLTLFDGISIRGTSPDSFIIDGDIEIQGSSTVSMLTVNGSINVVDTNSSGDDKVVIRNCIIRNSPVPGGINIPSGSGTTVSIVNNTIVNGGGPGISFSDPAKTTILNNIITGNDVAMLNLSSNNKIIKFNNIAGNTNDVSSSITLDASVILTDPVFVNLSNDDFHLSYASSAIDAGDPVSSYTGEPKPNGNRVNMGAFGNTTEARRTDTTAPVFLTSDPFDGSVTKSLSSVTIIMTDSEAGVDEANSEVSIDYDGSVFNGTYVRDNSTPNQILLTFSGNMEDGEYSINVKPVDRRGNFGELTKIVITQDSAVPLLTLNSFASVTNTKENISGTVQQGKIVTVSINGTTSEADYPTSTTWQFPLNSLLEGVNNITITADNAVQTIEIFYDTIPPKEIGDFTFSLSLTDITFTWTSPEDQGKTGRPSSYDLRYITKPAAEIKDLEYGTKQISEDVWNDATRLPTDISPQDSGTVENVTVSDIIKNVDTSYFFAMRTVDDAGNISAMSNEVEVALDSSGSNPVRKGSSSDAGGGGGCFIGIIK